MIRPKNYTPIDKRIQGARIATGCDSLHYSTTAEAFIDKGAKLDIGWTGLVSVADSDEATIKLLELL